MLNLSTNVAFLVGPVSSQNVEETCSANAETNGNQMWKNIVYSRVVFAWGHNEKSLGDRKLQMLPHFNPTAIAWPQAGFNKWPQSLSWGALLPLSIHLQVISNDILYTGTQIKS